MNVCLDTVTRVGCGASGERWRSGEREGSVCRCRPPKVERKGNNTRKIMKMACCYISACAHASVITPFYNKFEFPNVEQKLAAPLVVCVVVCYGATERAVCVA